jgi:HEAT repeat protein
VKIDAGRALWKVTGHSNAAISALEGVLRQNQDAGLRLWAARYLLDMGQADPLLTITFINSLTNGDIGMRMSACSCLGQIGRPAAAAIPSLRQALQDRDPEVRRRAKSALTSIDPEHP